MTVTVLEQAHSLLGALLLGVGAGLWYDLLRCLRYRIRSRVIAIALDLLFWLAVTAAIFVWSVAAGGGKVQISVCAALFLGGVVYFRFFSRLFFPILSALVRLLSQLLHLLLTPLIWLKRAAGRVRNFFINFCKKHFSFPGK